MSATKPYKILIALDSFKGSMDALQASRALAQGLKQAFAREHALLECDLMPLSDGGDGLLMALENVSLGYQKHSVSVLSPYKRRVQASYLLNGKQAILEMAQSTGLTLTPEHERRAIHASSYGLGEMIEDAYKKGAREIVLGVGGSGSNDGGAGCLQALGLRFRAKNGYFLPKGVSNKHLSYIKSIEGEIRLKELKLCILSDVSNPLLGKNGATSVYAPQKGIIEGDLEVMERNLSCFATLVERQIGVSLSELSGSGAAGGVVFGLRAFCDTEVKGGAWRVLELLRAKERLSGVDLVITGEGKFDTQSAFGKAPCAIAKLAHELLIPTIGVAGVLGKGYMKLHEHHIKAMFSLVNAPMSWNQAIVSGERLLRELGIELGGMILSIRGR